MGRKPLETRPSTSSSPTSSMKSLALLLTLHTAKAVTTAVGAVANTATTTAAASAVASGRNQHGGHHTSSADALLFVSPSAPRARGWVTGSIRGDAAVAPSPRRAWRSSWGDSGALKIAESKRDFSMLPRGSGALRMTSSSGAGEGEEDGEEVKSEGREINECPTMSVADDWCIFILV